MKIICTTSNGYDHVLKITVFLFNKFWDDRQQVEIVGYDKPNFDLPNNFIFHSLGKQTGGTTSFTRDLREYFKKQDKYFIWVMCDTFFKAQVNFKALKFLQSLTKNDNVGRIHLTIGIDRQKFYSVYNKQEDFIVYEAHQEAPYRLSTQPSIWSRDFVLKYMQQDLTPWEFELQPSINDDYHILGLSKIQSPVQHNEGVRKRDLYEYNLEGIDINVINEMKQLKLI